MDLKFTVRAGGGKSARLLLHDAQLLGGGRLVDLSYDNYAQKGAAVLALRLAYTGGTEVRASLRLPTTGRITGVLKHDFDDHQDILFLGLQVFQSNAPTGRTRYGCPQVGQRAALVLTESEDGDLAELTLSGCGNKVIRWAAGEAAVTLTQLRGHS